jgi:hypothetical protein
MYTIKLKIRVDCRGEFEDIGELPSYRNKIIDIVRTYLAPLATTLNFKGDYVTVSLSPKNHKILSKRVKRSDGYGTITIRKSIGMPGYHPFLEF